MGISNYPKHKVENCGGAASLPSQCPCWAGKQQQSLQLGSMKGGSFPTPHITLPVAQYHLGLFIDVMTPVGCCLLLLRNPLPTKWAVKMWPSFSAWCLSLNHQQLIFCVFIQCLQMFWSDFMPVLLGTWRQSMNRTRDPAEGPNTMFRYWPVHCSHEDGWVSVCGAGGRSFLTVAKYSFLQGKTQQLALAACHNPTLCFWPHERQTTSPLELWQEC